MPWYRLYTVAEDGHFQGPPTEYQSSDDRSAIDTAKRLLDGRDIEVWQEKRLVAYLVPDKK